MSSSSEWLLGLADDLEGAYGADRVREIAGKMDRFDYALRQIALYKDYPPAENFDHCVLIARHALCPENIHRELTQTGPRLARNRRFCAGAEAYEKELEAKDAEIKKLRAVYEAAKYVNQDQGGYHKPLYDAIAAYEPA